jgi:hypothetical protein
VLLRTRTYRAILGSERNRYEELFAQRAGREEKDEEKKRYVV